KEPRLLEHVDDRFVAAPTTRVIAPDVDDLSPYLNPFRAGVPVVLPVVFLQRRGEGPQCQVDIVRRHGLAQPLQTRLSGIAVPIPLDDVVIVVHAALTSRTADRACQHLLRAAFNTYPVRN